MFTIAVEGDGATELGRAGEDKEEAGAVGPADSAEGQTATATTTAATVAAEAAASPARTERLCLHLPRPHPDEQVRRDQLVQRWAEPVVQEQP